MITLENEFVTGAKALPDGSDASIKLEVSGIFTPRSEMATGRFSVRTSDAEDHTIDSDNSFVLPPPNAVLKIVDAETIQDSSKIGVLNPYDFLITSPYPLLADD